MRPLTQHSPTAGSIPLRQSTMKSPFPSTLPQSQPFVTYRGSSPLPQLRWSLPFTGPQIVLSLFDGVGSLFTALVMLGACFHALAWETNEDAIEVCQRTFQPVHHCDDVLHFDRSQVEPFLASRSYSAVIVMGGSPCQDASLLKSDRPGATSSRTQLFNAIPGVAQTCRSILQEHNISIPVTQVLENVHMASADFFHQACTAMHGPPLTISAGSFGWTRRDRSWWCSDGTRSSHDLLQLSLPSQLRATRGPHGWSIRWERKKPWPATVQFASGFQPCFDPAQVAKASEQLDCFPVFTRAFKHKPDRGPAGDEQTLQRFHQWREVPTFQGSALDETKQGPLTQQKEPA